MPEYELAVDEEASAVSMPLAAAYAFLRERLEADDASTAAGEVERVLARYPNDLNAHLLAGEALYGLGQADRARPHFERAVLADPEEPAAHVGLGVLAEEDGDSALAISEYLAASRLRPSLEGVREQIAAASGERPEYLDAVHLMRLHLASGDGIAALAEWQGVEDTIRSESWARLGLLHALWLAGRADEAEKLAHELLDSAPGSLKPALFISFIEARRGNQDAALAALAELRDEDPSGHWTANHAHSAPPTWRGPEWSATVEIVAPVEPVMLLK
nr:tetratricopeptide repeat protein [Chloroflexota bacterium]